VSSAIGAQSAPIAEQAAARETVPATTSARRRSWWPLAGLILPLALVVLWQVGAESGAIKTQIASTPGQVVSTLWTLLTNGVLFRDFLQTIVRIAFGFSIGLAAGLGLGILTGWARVADRLIDPTLRALNAVPAVGWIPFLILWLGIGDISKIALISLATFFPIYANTYAGIRSTDQKLIELALAYRLPRRTIVSRIVIPSAVPQILVGVRVAVAISWVVGTVSEILYGNNGLGVLLNDGRSLARPDQMVALLIVLAVLGKASDAVVVRLQRRLTSWQSNLDSMPAHKARVYAARGIEP
jgi:sulfonate transport system permease protein